MSFLTRLLNRRTKDAPVDQDMVREAADMDDKRISDYRLYEYAYDGEPHLKLTARERAYLETCGVRWRENFIAPIVNVVKDRMNVVGFQVDDDEPASDWLTKQAWQRNRMDAHQGTVHVNMMGLGDAFIVAEPGPTGMPVYRYNRPGLHKPVYNADGDMVCDVKKWATSEVSEQNPSGLPIWRLNLFYADRLEKYFSLDESGEHWVQWQDDGDAGWPLVWTMNRKPGGEPIGIPAIHFRNQPYGRMFGRSDIRGLLPFQQTLDKQLLDLFAVMDTQGWPQRWGTGIDNTGTLKVNPGEMVTGPEKANFGQFDPASPEGPLAAIEATLHRMAAFARVPIHTFLMEGQMPSGESLKTANSPLVKKANDRKIDAGNSWEDVQRIGWRIATAFGAPDVPAFDDDAQITTLWDSSEDRNETDEVGVALSKYDLGVSRTTLIRELGYDPVDEAKKRAEEQAAEGVPAPDDKPIPVTE